MGWHCQTKYWLADKSLFIFFYQPHQFQWNIYIYRLNIDMIIITVWIRNGGFNSIFFKNTIIWEKSRKGTNLPNLLNGQTLFGIRPALGNLFLWILLLPKEENELFKVWRPLEVECQIFSPSRMPGWGRNLHMSSFLFAKSILENSMTKKIWH